MVPRSSRRLEARSQRLRSESELIYKLFVHFLMLYSESEVPTVAGINGKVTAYGKRVNFRKLEIFLFSEARDLRNLLSFISPCHLGSAHLSSA